MLLLREASMTLSLQLQARILDRFGLDRTGIHGIAHWDRVRDNGLFLSKHTDADVAVIEAFAWLHDSCRLDDCGDPGHGHRAAEFVRELHADGLLELGLGQLDLLSEACRHHSCGRKEADLSVQICWDADRLDLGRVGTKPDPFYLCTGRARQRDTIRWALARSVGGEAPFPRY